MQLKRVLIELDPEMVQKILAIDLDGDQEEALRFIKESLAKQVKRAIQPH